MVELEPKAIRVLLYLIEHHERVVSKDELFEQIWAGVDVTDNALTRVVGQLRKGLGDDAKQGRLIETVPTVGYRFVGKLHAATAPTTASQRRPWLWALACFVLVSAGVAVWSRERAKPNADAIGVRTQQLTNSKTLDTGPTLSPDGRWIAYSSDRSGQFEIYLRPLDGQSQELQVTNDGGPNVEAAWSPDGKWIAYHCVARGGICMIPSMGGTVRELASRGSQPAWSPDSKKLVFRGASLISLSPFDLFGVLPYGFTILDIETGEKREFRDSHGNRSIPTWSRDGKWIVYSALPFQGRSRLAALRLRDGKTQELLEVDGLASAVCFSPDGRRLYFTRFTRPAGYGLHWMEIDPETMRPLGEAREAVRGLSVPMHMDISRDGKRMVVATVEQDSNLYRLSLQGNEPDRPLTNNRNFRNTFPSVSPDGKRIAYAVRQLGRPVQVWIMNADGSGQEPVSPPESSAIVPQWTREGDALLYRLVPGQQIERLRLADRTRKRWKANVDASGMTRATGRGTEAIFHEVEQDRVRLGFVDLATGQRRLIPTPKHNIAFGFLSPRGDQIAAESFEDGFTHAVTLPRNGGTPKQLTRGVEHAFLSDWSPDSRQIVFAGMRQGSWNLYTLDVNTGAERKLSDFRSLRTFVRYPAWSPANDWIVYERTETTGNIYLLDLTTR